MLHSRNAPSALVNQDHQDYRLVVQNSGSLTARFIDGASFIEGSGDALCCCLLHILKLLLLYVKVGKNLHT